MFAHCKTPNKIHISLKGTSGSVEKKPVALMALHVRDILFFLLKEDTVGN